MIFVSCVGSSWKRWLWQVRTQQWGVWSGTEDAWLWWWRPETWRQWLLRKIRDNIETISWLTLHHQQLIWTHSCETYPQLTAHQVSLYKYSKYRPWVTWYRGFHWFVMKCECERYFCNTLLPMIKYSQWPAGSNKLEITWNTMLAEMIILVAQNSLILSLNMSFV